MISRDSIAAVDLAAPRADSLDHLEKLSIDLPSYEANAVVHWSYPVLFPSPSHFWRRSQQALSDGGDPDRCFGVSIDEFTFGALSEELFLELLGECLDGSPLFTATLKPLGEFRWGTSLYDEWDTKIAVAHVGRLYLALYWETQA